MKKIYAKNYVKLVMTKTKLGTLLDYYYEKRDLKKYWTIIEQDIKKTRESLKQISNTNIDKKEKTVFVVNLSSVIYQAKMDALLARYLVEKDINIVVILYSRRRITQQYFEAFGIKKFIYLEDFINYADINAYYEKALEMCPQFDYAFLKEVKYKQQYEIGKQVLTTIGRKYKKGMASWNAEEMKNYVIEEMIEGMQIFDAMCRINGLYNPVCAIMNEIFYLRCSACANALLYNNINIAQYVRSMDGKQLVMKRRTSFDNLNLHPGSLTSSTFNIITEFPFSDEKSKEIKSKVLAPYVAGNEINQNNKFVKSKEEVYEQLGLDKNKKNAVIYSHVMWDANMFYGKDLYEDFEDWFVETIRTACKNPHVNWIVKMHPANVWKNPEKTICREQELIEENFDDLPDNIYLVRPDTDINTCSFFDITDYGITVRGTIGMELPCLGVPVLTAGTGRYSGQGFTIDSETIEQYENRLLHIHEIPSMNEETIRRARQYVYAIGELVPYKFDGVTVENNTQLGASHPFVFNSSFNVISKELFLQNDAANRFYKWIIEDSSIDSVSGI